MEGLKVCSELCALEHREMFREVPGESGRPFCSVARCSRISNLNCSQKFQKVDGGPRWSDQGETCKDLTIQKLWTLFKERGSRRFPRGPKKRLHPTFPTRAETDRNGIFNHFYALLNARNKQQTVNYAVTSCHMNMLVHFPC